MMSSTHCDCPSHATNPLNAFELILGQAFLELVSQLVFSINDNDLLEFLWLLQLVTRRSDMELRYVLF